VQELLLDLSGVVPGFPDDDQRKLDNLTRAWAEFTSTKPYRLRFHPQIEPYMTAADKKPYLWKEGLIPAEWLVMQVRKTCEFMPPPIVAREIYCAAGFAPEDGLMPDDMIGYRKKAQSETSEVVDISTKAS
jgi:hypothetical protein